MLLCLKHRGHRRSVGATCRTVSLVCQRRRLWTWHWHGHTLLLPVKLCRWHQHVPSSVDNQLRLSSPSQLIQDSTVTPLLHVLKLGLHLDSELPVKCCMPDVATICNYHLQCLRQIRWSVSQEVASQLVRVVAVVTSRLDWTIVIHCPTVTPLQQVQTWELCGSLDHSWAWLAHPVPTVLQSDVSSISNKHCQFWPDTFCPSIDVNRVWWTGVVHPLHIECAADLSEFRKQPKTKYYGLLLF